MTLVSQCFKSKFPFKDGSLDIMKHLRKKRKKITNLSSAFLPESKQISVRSNVKLRVQSQNGNFSLCIPPEVFFSF